MNLIASLPEKSYQALYYQKFEWAKPPGCQLGEEVKGELASYLLRSMHKSCQDFSFEGILMRIG